MSFRRRFALTVFALLTPVGMAACTAKGAGTTSECTVGGCTVTFDRGVNAKASLLGVDAELVAVNGNTVTMKVAGQQMEMPVGETEPAQGGLDVTVQEVTADNVVVKLSTGVNGGEQPS